MTSITTLVRPRIAICLGVLFLMMPSAGAQDTDALMKMSAAEIRKGIEKQHPVACYVLAKKLFESGERDEAVFWFYAGQLRYRFHLAANPDLDPSADPALFASLNEVIGRPLNEYAFGDLDALLGTVDRVLAWDEKTPNGFAEKKTHARELKEIREGLVGLKDYIARNKASIREQRTENGLENRKQ